MFNPSEKLSKTVIIKSTKRFRQVRTQCDKMKMIIFLVQIGYTECCCFFPYILVGLKVDYTNFSSNIADCADKPRRPLCSNRRCSLHFAQLQFFQRVTTNAAISYLFWIPYEICRTYKVLTLLVCITRIF